MPMSRMRPRPSPASAMTDQRAAIIQLCQCLRGAPPNQVDWMSVIGLANQTLTTPALMEFTKRFPKFVPEEVARYVEEIFARNLLRNDRLVVQLNEAVAALNQRGVTPILLKGAATLALKDRTAAASRLISDLDILVSPNESDAALKCLLALGYRIHYQAPPSAAKWYVDLERQQDVGMVDLQRSLPGHPFFYCSHGDVRQYCTLIKNEHGSVYIPNPTYQALMLVIHDEFQDSDYWVGSFDLRHLLDLRELVNAPEGLDWRMLARLAPSRLMRNAVETQLMALFVLLGVDVPPTMRARLIPRLQFRRRLLQARYPLLRHALLMLTVLDYRNYRAELGRAERAIKQLEPRTWALPKMNTMRFLFDVSRERRSGKV